MIILYDLEPFFLFSSATGHLEHFADSSDELNCFLNLFSVNNVATIPIKTKIINCISIMKILKTGHPDKQVMRQNKPINSCKPSLTWAISMNWFHFLQWQM